MGTVRVGILGATGMVGQHYVSLLKQHPFFEVCFLAASKESSGKSYAEALADKGRTIHALPGRLCSLKVHGMNEISCAKELCDFVFSAVNTETAKVYENLYAADGLPVISNTSFHRMDADVPLLIPEINPEHLDMIPLQKKNRGWKKGFIVTKPNCSLQSYLIPLFPLHRQFGVKKIIVSTMQAVSGAGYPGVSSLDIIDNVIPYIDGEEKKSEIEPLKILGKIQGDQIVLNEGILISAHCNRVPVIDGHTACISVQFEKKPKREELLDLWRQFTGLPQQLCLPSAPMNPIIYREEKDRPQPRLDRDAGHGMAITVGRLRDCQVLDFRFVGLSHNALRGAASGGILNAELLFAKGYFS